MLQIIENEPLAKYTSYKIGGPARYFCTPKSLSHLDQIRDFLLTKRTPFFILGNGTNLLVPDEGLEALVIRTISLPQFLVPIDATKINVSAACFNSRVLRASAEWGMGGLEYLAGVPGSIGGAVWMNAGTATGEIKDNLLGLETYSLRDGRKSYRKSDLKFSYRKNLFLSGEEIILSAVFELTQGQPQEINERIASSLKSRKSSQPLELPSCGSVFKNPTGKSAWKCIEEVGLRGHKVGGACISEKHCNFIVNLGGAKFSDVRALIELAKTEVKAKLKIDLQEEVIIPVPRCL